MRIWSERNGRTDIVAHGFSLLDTLVVTLAGFVVLAAAIAVLAVMR